MLFSCKLTSSVLSFVEARGQDINPLIEGCTLPEEFLRDASYWMAASDLENFLKKAVDLYSSGNGEDLLREIGHSVVKLRSWGVFDSVLRMMPEPQVLLQQPEKFFASFISPPPPAMNFSRLESHISFDLPIPTEKYPLTKALIETSLEALPAFAGKDFGVCQWSNLKLSYSWVEGQPDMFSSEDVGRQMSPDLIDSVIHSLQKHQQDLEKKNSELQLANEKLNQELAKAVSVEVKPTIPSLDRVFESSRGLSSADRTALNFSTQSQDQLEQNLARLQDYMVRAQQLITMLVAQDRLSPQVKVAMKKVDWENVKLVYPQLISECRQIIRSDLEQMNSDQQGESHV